MKNFLLLTALLLCYAGTASAQVVNRVNWETFLGRNDLVWNRAPDRFESAAYTGNGQLGAMIFSSDKGQTLKWQMGRSDVHFLNSRIPIGDLVLAPSGKVQSCTMRLDLWNAEARGTVTTDKGSIQFRSFTHSGEMVQLFEAVVTGKEKATWSWVPGDASNPRKIYKKQSLTPDDQNAAPVRSREGALDVSFQPLKPAGGHAVAWRVVEAGKGRSIVYASVGFSTQEATARTEAMAAVTKGVAIGLDALTQTHRAWWHQFWPEGFVSIPDSRLESFYYLQMYKMASATRPGRPVLDLMGPWFRTTPWARIWWNLNIQLAYWPQLTGNRLELGQSLCELIDNHASELAANAGPFSADSAGVGRATGYDCKGGVGPELCNLPWTMHNYWLHYRYCMDDQMLRERLFPMLKRSINYYLHLLSEGPDGKLHITRGLSPEYENQPSPNPDCNIDLSLLRWGCQTLLQSCERLKLNDPQIPQWKNTLAKLTPYPQDQNGLMISASVPFSHSHRHFSHLLMIYPLYIMTLEQPENRALVIKSLKHWMGMPEHLAGYSFTGASSISALLEEGDEAARYLNKLLDSKIPPNTLYVEAGPCIETPLAAAASLNDMMLSSWGDRIRVFPGAPNAWKDIAFHNLRTEGAFLVSAARKNGKTQWVRVKSLAGEPCRIRPGLDGEVKATVPMKAAGNEAVDLTLAKGGEAILYTGAHVPACEIAPVAADPAKTNFFGLH